MSDTHPIGNRCYITELDIRIWLRDNDPEANNLIKDYEFSSEEIRTAMTLAVDKWNDTPPILVNHNFTVNTFPYRSAYIKGTSANLLFIAANRFRRNSLKYNVPGGMVADQEKYQEYDAAGQKLWDEYTQWMHHFKRAINMEEGFALIH